MNMQGGMAGGQSRGGCSRLMHLTYAAFQTAAAVTLGISFGMPYKSTDGHEFQPSIGGPSETASFIMHLVACLGCIVGVVFSIHNPWDRRFFLQRRGAPGKGFVQHVKELQHNHGGFVLAFRVILLGLVIGICIFDPVSLGGSNWDTGTWALILTDGIAGFIGCGGEAIITYRHIESQGDAAADGGYDQMGGGMMGGGMDMGMGGGGMDMGMGMGGMPGGGMY